MLDSKNFKIIIENTPLVSIDLCIVCDSQILLGKRENEPLKGVWFTPGGRIFKMKLGKIVCAGSQALNWRWMFVIQMSFG